MLNRKSSIVNRKFFAGLLLLILTACTAGKTPAPSARPRPVLAAETWLADIARNVAGDHQPVDSLLPPGVDPHEFQMTPQDAIKVTESRVLIYNGLNYEPWLLNAIPDGGPPRTLISAADGNNTLVGAAQPGTDPHMWMDPSNVVIYVEHIRDGLTAADPSGKDVYAANADRYIAKLHDLDAWIKSQVATIPPEKRLLVTSHDSLGYFAKAYGFQVVGAVIPSVTNEASPSAQQMAALIDQVKQTHAPAIFLDPTENRNLAEQISSATGAKVITDLYVESLSNPAGPAPTYIDMLKHDVTVIVEALKQ